ncbi:winged helix-turn-helix domain-containing protein [Bacillus rhizoplanae]|uniref:winged helix-turn-helix domain-containing protein n=1 Tax=Bacillus rhizoplanae TaxID=2880966 RepID=UPI003D1DF8AC
MYKILIIEDDLKIADILEGHLEKYGYQSVRVQDFRHIKDEFAKVNPHLVLLDINLPYFDGFYWCRQIRTISNAPIIFVSARTGEMDQVMAIENGGDDYITKPFHLDIVMAKVKSALRRVYGEYASGAESDYFGVSGLLLFPAQHMVEWQGKQVELTKNEYYLLECLMKQADQYVTREELLEALWDEIAFVDDNTLTVNVKRVRKKLEEIGIVDAIVTKRGYGYALLTNWVNEHES